MQSVSIAFTPKNIFVMPADERQRREEPVGLDVRAQHELEVGRPIGEEREGAETARHVRHHEGHERHRGRHRLPGNGQRLRLVGFLNLVWNWMK